MTAFVYSERMCTSSWLSPAEWAQTEFSFARLGDQRRTKRLVRIAEALAMNPDGTLPQAMDNWAELKAAYRFLNQSGVSFESIGASHWQRTVDACRQPGEYLIIEDTTALDYTKRDATEGLGPIGDGTGKGLLLHSALAMRVENWTLEQRPEGTVVGLFGQRCCRPRRAPKGERLPERLGRARQSQLWAGAFDAAGPPPPGSQWIYIADRESDCYETLAKCQRLAVDFVVRACQNRRLVGEQAGLREAVSQAPVLGRMTVEVRARGNQPARTAIVELRTRPVTIDGPWRPGGWQPPLETIQVVEVREVDAPEGIQEPLHWILLTSLPCQRLSEVKRVVGRYTARWVIEEYHKALKSGTGVENSQLEKAYRLEALIAVLALVAVRLLSVKMLARSRPEQFEAVQSFGSQALKILEKQLGPPQGGWTNENLIRAVARLGGFLARKHDGMPGWQTIWRGWHRLMWMCEGLEILNEETKKCG